MKHGKTYRQARGQIDRERTYSPVEAIRMLKGFDGVKFDETVEVHFRLGLNVRHADQQLRGTIMLPHGTGREVRVASTRIPGPIVLVSVIWRMYRPFAAAGLARTSSSISAA